MTKTLTISFWLLAVSSLSAQDVWTHRHTGDGEVCRVAAGKPGLYLVGTEYWNDALPSDPPVFRYFRSVDGLKWEVVHLPHARRLFCLDGKIMGAGTYGVWTSEDGLSWEMEPGLAGTSFTHIASGNGTLVASTVESVYFKRSGEPWTKALLPVSSIKALAFGSGRFLLLSGSDVLASEDGSSWSIISRNGPGGEFLFYAQDRFFADSYTSTDRGSTWKQSASSYYLSEPFAFNGDTVLFFGGTGSTTADLWKSTVTSNYQKLEPNISGYIYTLCFAGDLWIAGGENGIITTAPDISTPPLAAPPLDAAPAVSLSWPSVAGRRYQVQTSTDNENWTDTGLPLNGDGSILRYNLPVSEPKRFWRVRAQ